MVKRKLQSLRQNLAEKLQVYSSIYLQRVRRGLPKWSRTARNTIVKPSIRISKKISKRTRSWLWKKLKQHWRWFYYKEGWMYYGYGLTVLMFPFLWVLMTMLGVFIFGNPWEW